MLCSICAVAPVNPLPHHHIHLPRFPSLGIFSLALDCTYYDSTITNEKFWPQVQCFHTPHVAIIAVSVAVAALALLMASAIRRRKVGARCTGKCVHVQGLPCTLTNNFQLPLLEPQAMVLATASAELNPTCRELTAQANHRQAAVSHLRHCLC